MCTAIGLILTRVYFILIIIEPIILARPTLQTIDVNGTRSLRVIGSPNITPPEIIQHLRKFGYLEQTPSDSEALYREDAIVSAIRNLQKFGAINQSGILDEETIKLLTAPRCGVPDIVHNTQKRSKRFVIGSKSWQKRRITYFIANWSPKIGEEKVVADMKTAFRTWGQYGRIQFVRVYDPSADIIVAFGTGDHGDRYPFDGEGNILAHAFYPYEMHSYGGDIHFDDDENWQENTTLLKDGVNFYAVAVHELGHSLGLAHSPIYSSIMFPYYIPDHTDLGYDDILAMYQLYIQSTLEEDNWITTTHPNEYTDNIFNGLDTTTARSPIVTLPPIPDPVDSDEEDDYMTTKKSIQTTFIGDYDTVEGHKRRFGMTTVGPDMKPLIPDICNGSFDAVASLRGEIFIFKEEFVWRLTDKYRIKPGYPVKIHQIFTELPTSLKKIDAIYERDVDNKIILFKGKEYWIYDGDSFIHDSPNYLTNYGITDDIEHIDAAMVWGKNGRTYLFSGNQFWRYDEESRQLDDGYPKNMSRWRGIPSPIDTAVTTTNGKTYFFKNNLYWLYNNEEIWPETGYPRLASNAWLGCSLSNQPDILNAE